MPRLHPDPPDIEPDWTDWEAIGYLVLLGLMTFFFSLRCYAKIKLRQPLLAEDWCCSISWILSGLEIAISCKKTKGKALGDVDVGQDRVSRSFFFAWLYAVSIVYGPAVLATKLTLLVIMGRMFPIHNIVALGIRLFIASMLVFYFTLTLMKAFVCHPVRAFWDAEMLDHGGHCMNQTTIFIADTSFAVLTDATILVLPIFLAVPLRIPFLKKLKVIVMLGAGGVAVGVTIYRALLIVDYQHTTNYTQDFAKILFYCLMEVAIGQICACLPFTNLLLKKRANECKIRASMSNAQTTLLRSRHRLKSFDSTFAHFKKQRMSSNGYDESRPRPKGCSSNTATSAGDLEAYKSQPICFQNRAVDTKGIGCQAPFLSRVVTSWRMAVAEEDHEAAPCPVSRLAVDDWYWHDLERGRSLPGDAEPLPPRPCATNMVRTPDEVLLPDRVVS